MKAKNRPTIRLLFERCRALLQKDASKKHYSEKDYRKAERKFLKHALEQREMEIREERFK